MGTGVKAIHDFEFPRPLDRAFSLVHFWRYFWELLKMIALNETEMILRSEDQIS